MPKKKNTTTFYEAVGRRKSATARARLHIALGDKEIRVGDTVVKKGQIIVNGKPAKEYFTYNLAQYTYQKPLSTTDSIDRFAVSVTVSGGGSSGQVEAISLALARALQKVDADMRPALKKERLLTRDPRVKERRKPGTGGKARRKKQSPKR